MLVPLATVRLLFHTIRNRQSPQKEKTMPEIMFDDIDLVDVADEHEAVEREELRKQILIVAGRMGARVRELAKQGDLEGLKALETGQTVINDEETQALIDRLTRELTDEIKRAKKAEAELREARDTINRLERKPVKDDDPDKTTTKSFGSKVRGRLGSR